MPRELNDIWLAGFFDGEGHLCLADPNGKGGLRNPRVTLSQNDRGILELVKTRFGGYITARETKGILNHCWHGESKEVVREFLLTILPHLRLKHKRATILIEICKYITGPGGHMSERDQLIRYRLEELFDTEEYNVS